MTVAIPFVDRRRSFEDPKPAWGRDAATRQVWVRCGVCGRCMDLDPGHTVAGDGTVAPSLFHDGDGCGWHVFGRLLEWTP